MEDERNQFTESVLKVLQNNKFCVVSTVSEDGSPQGAVMAFSQTDDLKIVFQTPSNSRKYMNLHENDRIAITVGWDKEDMVTVQYEGRARELSEEEIDQYREMHVRKNEDSRAYAYLPENKYFIVSPTWVRYSDLVGGEIHEEDFTI